MADGVRQWIGRPYRPVVGRGAAANMTPMVSMTMTVPVAATPSGLGIPRFSPGGAFLPASLVLPGRAKRPAFRVKLCLVGHNDSRYD